MAALIFMIDPQRDARFPAVRGENLNGRVFDLPAGFEQPAIVFLAYVRGQQREIDTWLPLVGELRRQHPALRMFELPVLSRSDERFRAAIDAGMREGIRDAAVRDLTVTLYIDKRAFNAGLGVSAEESITVLLVLPNGEVRWRACGPYDPSHAKALRDAVAAALL